MYVSVHYPTIDSDNGLSPVRCQAIIWANADILSIWPLGINFTGILMEIKTFSFKEVSLKMLSAKRRPFCLGLGGLIQWILFSYHCKIKLKAVTNNTRNSAGRKWKHILDHPGWVEAKLHTQRRSLGIWYFTLDGILASNFVGYLSNASIVRVKYFSKYDI